MGYKKTDKTGDFNSLTHVSIYCCFYRDGYPCLSPPSREQKLRSKGYIKAKTSMILPLPGETIMHGTKLALVRLSYKD